MEDIEVLDEGLKLFMDGDGQPRQQSSRAGPLSWRRVSEAYLRPLVSLVERFYRPPDCVYCVSVFGPVILEVGHSTLRQRYFLFRKHHPGIITQQEERPHGASFFFFFLVVFFCCCFSG